MTDPTPLDLVTLAAIRSRDDERTLTYGSGWGAAAVADRRALLGEVDRLAEVLALTRSVLGASSRNEVKFTDELRVLAEALAVAERERDEAGQSSLNRLAQNIDLRTALTAERAKVARVESVVTERPWLGDSGRRNYLLLCRALAEGAAEDRACYRCGREVGPDSDAARCSECTSELAGGAADQPQPDGYCSCRGLPERTCGIRLHRLSAGADQ